MRPRYLLCTLLLLSLNACLFAPNQTAPGRIVFQSEQGESYELFIVNPDGSQLTRLTNNNDYELWPVGSPDGEYIAFVHLMADEEPYEGMDIWVTRTDGSGVTPVTSIFGGERFPNWSPDGRRIAYSCETWRYDICVINFDGSQMTQLTTDDSSSYQMTLNALTTARQWSPNGNMIVFVEGSDEVWGIVLINADGSGYLRLTTDFASFDPTWAPTGTEIAFVRSEPQGCEDNCNLEIYVINSDGSELTNLTNNSAEDFNPVWSPNGEKLAFVSTRDGNYELYVLDMRSSNITRITDDPAFDGQPTWSPDGQRIAFTSDRNGNAEIYVVDLNGENLVRLTTNQVEDSFPYWLSK